VNTAIQIKMSRVTSIIISDLYNEFYVFFETEANALIFRMVTCVLELLCTIGSRFFIRSHRLRRISYLGLTRETHFLKRLT